MWHKKRVACGAAALAVAMVLIPLFGPPAPAVILDTVIPGQGMSLSAASTVALAKKPAPPRDPARIHVPVPKKYPLVPQTHAPPMSTIPGTGARLRPVASKASKKLAAGARTDGVSIRITSGYHSFAVEKSLLTTYTRIHGSTYAQRIAAKPGTSEHQTGLAVDVGNPGGACVLLRFDQGRDLDVPQRPQTRVHPSIPPRQGKTIGYIYEPCHFRFVGIAQAKSMKSSKAKTLEHHYPVASGPQGAQHCPPMGSANKKTTTNLSMRRGPSLGAGVLTTAPKGSTVVATGEKSGIRVQVRHAGKSGWMSSNHLR